MRSMKAIKSGCLSSLHFSCSCLWKNIVIGGPVGSVDLFLCSQFYHVSHQGVVSVTNSTQLVACELDAG